MIKIINIVYYLPQWLKLISWLMLWKLSLMLKEKERSKFCWDLSLRFWLNSSGLCRSITILETFRLLIIIRAKRLLSNLLEESINVESSHPDMILFYQNLKNGPAIFFPPGSSVTLSSQPLRASSPMKNAGKDT